MTLAAIANRRTERLRSFPHGVHPPEFKDSTRDLPIERIPFVDEYVLPLSQHTGAPSEPVVRPGDRVRRGQLIAQPKGFVSTALHAPVTGTVQAIELRAHPNGKLLPAIVLRADPFASQRVEQAEASAGGGSEAITRVQMGGLVGMGGAAFPTHVKLKVPDGSRAEVLVVNGCECEPYLTCDHRLMLERPDAILRGLALTLGITHLSRAVIGVEANKADAAEALRRLAPPEVEVMLLNVKYPQGAEKMLLKAVLGRAVPPGKLPIDVGAVVGNVGTMAALADWFDRGLPLIERVVTVTGPGIARPRNVLAPLGTPVAALIEHCGGLLDGAGAVILGGPMMGFAQKTLDVPVTKGLSGVVVLRPDADADGSSPYPCIRCGRCLEACPMYLNPTRLIHLVQAERVEALPAHNILSCFECGACSYACPSRIPIVHWIRVGKAMMAKAKAA